MEAFGGNIEKKENYYRTSFILFEFIGILSILTYINSLINIWSIIESVDMQNVLIILHFVMVVYLIYSIWIAISTVHNSLCRWDTSKVSKFDEKGLRYITCILQLSVYHLQLEPHKDWPGELDMVYDTFLPVKITFFSWVLMLCHFFIMLFFLDLAGVRTLTYVFAFVIHWFHMICMYGS